MQGIIYVLTNQAMPGFVKIGKTEGALAARIRSLSSTSVPFEFECFYAARVADCSAAEYLLHDAFADHRANPRREFFQIEPERVRSALKLAAIQDVTPGVEEVVPDQSERAAIKAMATRRGGVSLTDLKIRPGEFLILDRGQATTCEVVDGLTVRYQSQVMSLSRAALLALRALGYDWSSANGWLHWTFEGRPLREPVDHFLASR